jgi:hypothetical protein
MLEIIVEGEDGAGTMKVESGEDSAGLEQRRWRKEEKSRKKEKTVLEQ